MWLWLNESVVTVRALFGEMGQEEREKEEGDRGREMEREVVG